MPEPEKINIAGVVLQDEQSRYLLVQEKRPDVYGLWNLPAGHTDEGESPQQAAVREAKEEVGFDVELIGDEPLVSTFDKYKKSQLNSFIARIIGGELMPQGEELLDARWFTIQEVEELNQNNKIRDPWVLKSIQKAENP
jgi:8-oxo-dGTP pyrophosphatase MutT (NUDIX family)